MENNLVGSLMLIMINADDNKISVIGLQSIPDANIPSLKILFMRNH